MPDELDSLKPIEGTARPGRRRLARKDELLLALLPTVTILIVLGVVESLTQQRVLFASLASSAFLIYLDPKHGTNAVRSLVIAQMSAALLGWGTHVAFGGGYAAAATAMVGSILIMVLADAVHPPAASTALAFAFRANNESNVILFGLAVGVTALLVVLERATLWVLVRRTRRGPPDAAGGRQLSRPGEPGA